ncbi:MAG TPA: serine hydrolase domain-containing protein [Flavipsychrobacter sp.]|nr:serine hydrolase domain-containing protein [Flavipsychrobacter sp.]
MKIRFNFYVLLCVLTVSILACRSHSEEVNAHPKFDAPIDTTPLQPIQYADTTSPYYQNLIRRLDSFYQVQVKAGFNGSVLLGEKGKIFYERYFGYQNKELKYPLRSNTASQLASTSKTFTGAAILYLYQHNYLNIDDPVKTYLPQFPYDGITIKMLLNHRSGLPDYLKWYGRFVKDSKTPVYNDQIMTLFAKYKPALDFKTNTAFKYSNSNYATLASIIEAVTEMKYADFMKRYIFDPLGMKNTFIYDPANGLPATAAISYKANWIREPDMFADGVYGDKGIYSTVHDMYLWDQSFYQKKILDNETMELAYGPCSFEKPGVKNYGLGWRMLCFPSGNKIVYHNGWWHGNNTVFYRFIKENMTFIILGNKYNSGIYRQTKVLYSIIKNVPVGEGFDEE